MPKIVISSEVVKFLKEKNIYDKWLDNLKAQWNVVNNTSGLINQSIDSIVNTGEMSDVILKAFRWDDSNEGQEFWREIYKNI